MGWTRTNPDVVAVVGPFSPFFKQPHQSERHIVMASCRGALGLHDVCPREIADPTQWNASRSCSWTEKKFKDAGPLIAITTAPHSCSWICDLLCPPQPALSNLESDTDSQIPRLENPKEPPTHQHILVDRPRPGFPTEPRPSSRLAEATGTRPWLQSCPPGQQCLAPSRPQRTAMPRSHSPVRRATSTPSRAREIQ